ncbi:hypothetical protein LG293_17420 (plasmid) [Citricoccus nitrophenolicus]
MSETSTRNRQPRGISTGGQFATETKSELHGIVLTNPASTSEPVIETTGPASDDERLCDQTSFAAVVTQPALIDGVQGTIHAAYEAVDYGPVAVERTTYLSREDLLAGHATGSPEKLLAGATKDYAYETIFSLVDEQVANGIQVDFSGTPENPKPETAADPAAPSAGIVDALPWPVPDLSAEQQEKTGLPADFTAAFDTYFAEAHDVLDRHEGRANDAVAELKADRDEALKKLIRSFPGASINTIRTDLPDRPDHRSTDCWQLDEPTDAKTTSITYMSGHDDEWMGNYWHEGPTLSTKGKVARQHADAARGADETIHRIGQLQRVRSGEDAAWNFLPATYPQEARSKNVPEQNSYELSDIRRREEARKRTDWAVEHEGKSQDDLRQEFVDNHEYGPAYRRFTREKEMVWKPKDGYFAFDVYYSREALEEGGADYARRRYPEIQRALAERAKIESTPEADEIKRTELEEKNRYYRQIVGWPGGDMSPQQMKDGTWSFFIPGDRVGQGHWEDAPTQG